MVAIRNFGNDTECPTPEALLTALQQYHGKSISIQYENPDNFQRVLLVDVDSAGLVTDSGTDTVITSEQLCSKVFAQSSTSSSPSWDDFESSDDLQLGEPLAVPKACSIDDAQCESCT